MPSTSCNSHSPDLNGSNPSTNLVAVSPSSPGSPIRSAQTGRVLRRKRSSANAALTSRPSLVSLRGRDRDHHQHHHHHHHHPHHHKSPASPTASSRELVEELGMQSLSLGEAAMATTVISATTMATYTERKLDEQPLLALSIPMSSSEWDRHTMEDDQPAELKRQECILIHTTKRTQTTSSPTKLTTFSTPQLEHALIQPNYLIDAGGNVNAVVDREKWEQLRATAEESRIVFMQAKSDDPVDANNIQRRSFDLSPSSSSFCESIFHIQPSMQSGLTGESSSLMTLTIRAEDWATLDDPTAWSSLPSQVQALLGQARSIQLDHQSAFSTQGTTTLRDHILHLAETP